MKDWLFICMALLPGFLPGQEQASCGTASLLWKRVVQNNTLTSRLADIEYNINNHLHDSIFQASPRGGIVLPVVFHVVWNTAEENVCDDRIYSQIMALNRDFSASNGDIGSVPAEFEAAVAEVGIQFALAQTDPSGHKTGGIVRVRTSVLQIGVKDSLYYRALGGDDAWDPEHYLNIWVANTGKHITGLGTQPGWALPEESGVVIHPKYLGLNESRAYNLGRVGVHEVGHYLGLSHIWGDNSSCESDDGINDTPPQGDYYSGCPEYPQYSCGYSNMFMNFMDYVDDPCMVMFSKGQKDRMLVTLAAFRSGLLEFSDQLTVPTSGDQIDFSVYPNPVQEALYYRVTKYPVSGGDVPVGIFDAWGRALRVEACAKSEADARLDTRDLPRGVYYIRIGTCSRKFIKF